MSGMMKEKKPYGQVIIALGLCLPLIIWMNGIDAPAETCGINVKMWLMVYWITFGADMVNQCIAMTVLP